MNLSPLPIQKFFDNAGRPLNGGLLFTYVAGTTTKLATYQDQAGTPNTNPVVLNFRGEANVWLDQTLTYKFVLSPDGDTDPPSKPIWSVDNISAGITFASLTAQILGMILWPRTPSEVAAGVVPVAYRYEPGNIRRYGAIVDGATDDSPAVRLALNAVPLLSGGRIFCDPPGSIKISSVVYIPQRIAGPGYGIDMDFEGSTFIGQGTGVGTIFESGTGATSSATNFGQPNESTTSIHYGTRIHGATFANYGIAIKLYNFITGCSLSNLTSFTGKTMVYTLRCFYLGWNEVNANVNNLLATDAIYDFYEEINTMTFNNVHAGGGLTKLGIGYRFNHAVKGINLAGVGAENLSIGYQFLGAIDGVNLIGSYIESNAVAIYIGVSAEAFNVEANYVNSNTIFITGDNWISGRLGHNKYDVGGGNNNDVNLSAAGNLCEIWIPPRQYAKQGGTSPHTAWTLLPSNWTANAGCRLRLTDYIYNQASGFNSGVAWLASQAGGDGQIAKQYTGKPNATHVGQIPFCTTSVVGTTLTVDTHIVFDADAGGITFDVIVDDNVTRRYVSGRTFGGTSVFRYDAQAMTVTVSNNGGFFRFVFAGYSVAASLVGGEIRLI